MKKGVLIFAHNSRDVDYALTAVISAGLANKYLKVPVSLVTDKSTIEWMKSSDYYYKATDIFDNIIEIDRPDISNYRRISDGAESTTIPFINSTRSDAWMLTPYDRTLLIDSDYLIFSDVLSEYWDCNSDFMISSAMNDIKGDRIGVLDRWVSDEGIPMMWATTIMFTKNQNSKLYFDLVKEIKENYKIFSDIYRFNTHVYRNDIAFSIAKHIIEGFTHDVSNCLPPIFTVQDKDIIQTVNSSGVKFLIHDPSTANMILSNVHNRDVHVMNKQSIVRNASAFMDLL
jgi:hypothetical protein